MEEIFHWRSEVRKARGKLTQLLSAGRCWLNADFSSAWSRRILHHTVPHRQVGLGRTLDDEAVLPVGRNLRGKRKRQVIKRGCQAAPVAAKDRLVRAIRDYRVNPRNGKRLACAVAKKLARICYPRSETTSRLVKASG